MNSHTQERLFLSNVSYSDERKRICLEFSNLNKKITKCHAFFPAFHLFGLEKERLLQSISSFSPNSFKVFKENDAVKVVAKNFLTLKQISEFLQKELNKEILLLSPERQFLLLNNFSYFDSFIINKEDEAIKLQELSFPKTVTDFSSEPLNEAFIQLKEFDKNAAKKFLNSLILSNILKIPFQNIPINKNKQFEIFLENLFFKNSFYTHFNSDEVISFRKPFKEKTFPNAIELDFSRVFSQLLLQNNIGFDSLNCSCCKARDFFSPNVLPSSLIKAKFKEEAFYFNSAFNWFAEKFHLTHPKKNLRLQRKKEFFLNSFPVGPFYSNQEELIPLTDALLLRENNSIEILPNTHELAWYCNKKKSFLPKELSLLLKKSNSLKDSLNLISKNMLSQHNLQAFSLLEKDIEYGFKKSYSELLLALFNYSSHYLTSASNKYFSKKLFQAILSLQAIVLENLKEFLEEKNARFLYAKNNKVFLQNLDSFDLEEFFEKQKITLQ